MLSSDSTVPVGTITRDLHEHMKWSLKVWVSPGAKLTAMKWSMSLTPTAQQNCNNCSNKNPQDKTMTTCMTQFQLSHFMHISTFRVYSCKWYKIQKLDADSNDSTIRNRIVLSLNINSVLARMNTSCSLLCKFCRPARCYKFHQKFMQTLVVTINAPTMINTLRVSRQDKNAHFFHNHAQKQSAECIYLTQHLTKTWLGTYCKKTSVWLFGQLCNYNISP